MMIDSPCSDFIEFYSAAVPMLLILESHVNALNGDIDVVQQIQQHLFNHAVLFLILFLLKQSILHIFYALLNHPVFVADEGLKEVGLLVGVGGQK